MQPPNAARKLSKIDRELIEVRVRALLDLRSNNNVLEMLKYVAPDVQYKVGSWRAYPFHASRTGIEELAELGRAVVVAYENLGSTINELVIDGDRVAIQRTAKIRNRGTGKTIDVEICNFIRFRDGLVVEFSEYPDTVAFAKLEQGVE
jgi:uncharacterized protein